MILRRLTTNFRKQDWTAVTVELVIVVLGVFIGLQAQDWASARADQRRADVLLQQLRGDLDGEKGNVKTYMDYQEVTAAYAKTAIRGLESPGSVDPNTWLASVYQATQIFSPKSNRSTFDEMKSTGAIDLIGNIRFRALLINYYSFDLTQSSVVKAQAPSRELVRSILPYSIQQAIKASCGDTVDVIDGIVVTVLPKTCQFDAPAVDIARATETLHATPALLPALTYQLSLIETNIEAVGANQQLLSDLIAAAGKRAP
jgi:peptidoglycan hydrolase-like protein with peptidoglycan-binding domain